MTGKLLVVDLDGTLFVPRRIHKLIPKKNLKFLRSFIDEGNKVIFASSRSYQFSKKLQEELDRPCSFICCNGSQVINENGEFYQNISFEREEIKNLLESIDNEYKPKLFLLYCEDHHMVITDKGRLPGLFKFFYKFANRIQFSRKENYVLSNDMYDNELENGIIYKATFFFGVTKKKRNHAIEVNRYIREKYPEIESVWSGLVDEISPKDVNKGTSLKLFSEREGISHDDIYVIGDGGNDIPMFKEYYQNSFAMTKTPSVVKKYAKHTVNRVFNLEKYLLKGEN
ncbi:MAG: HAD family hydrolase [Coprobacillus sp.]|nr:HAD family hydrolase [Coprobacillus sp.]